PAPAGPAAVHTRSHPAERVAAGGRAGGRRTGGSPTTRPGCWPWPASWRTHRRAPPTHPPGRTGTANPYTSTEFSFALTWTEYAGGAFTDTAIACLERLPALHQAMLAGRADLPKVRLIAAELGDATDEHARAVVATLPPELPRCTTTQ